MNVLNFFRRGRTTAQLRRFWDGLAAEFDFIHPQAIAFVSRLLAHEQLSGRILDLMAGHGPYFRNPYNVVAADVSGALLEKNKSTKRVQCNIDPATAGGKKLPFKSE